MVNRCCLVYVLQAALMACPCRACTLQGCLGVGRGVLAAVETSNASGWKQSKENRSVCAVAGPHA